MGERIFPMQYKVKSKRLILITFIVMEHHMQSKNKYPGIDPSIIKQIRKRARQIKSYKCCVSSDIEDIEQQLLCETWSDLSQYNGEESGRNAFIHSVIKNHAISLLRKQSCAKRGSKAGVSFVDITDLDDVIDENSYFEDKVAASIDINEAISKLPKLWQDISHQLESHSISEIAEMHGISRTTIYKIREQIRAELSHLKIYL